MSNKKDNKIMKVAILVISNLVMLSLLIIRWITKSQQFKLKFWTKCTTKYVYHVSQFNSMGFVKNSLQYNLLLVDFLFNLFSTNR